MKRHIPDKRYFTLLRMLDEFARSEGLSIDDAIACDKFLGHLSKIIQEHRSNPTLVHGFRVESMFAHVAAALGESQIISEEDSGIFFSIPEDIRRPDFRVLTRKGDQYFIEVKNFHPNDPFDSYPIEGDYLSSLCSYADNFKIPLKLAIYWSHWNLWTLVDVNYLDRVKSDLQISLPDAMKRNEMNSLGDCMIGTKPPLSLRLYADTEKPRSVDEKGECSFTIGRAAICVGGKEINDPLESKLAWFFMLHGKWNEVDEPAEIVDGLLEYTEMTFSPMEFDHEQGFAMVGFLSEMISRNYNFLTSREGVIRRLIPKQPPHQLSVLIPPDYRGQVLKLWRFYVKPNYEDIIRHNDSQPLTAEDGQ